MPMLLIERLPVPSLRTYTSLSFAVISISIAYAYKNLTESGRLVGFIGDEGSDSYWTYRKAWNVASQMTEFMIKDNLCVWTLINMAYCCLMLLGRLIQSAMFGDLRVSEHEHLKDKFWNFLFYKFIFIFGVMNVQDMEAIFLWSAWFSILGFFHLLTQLSKDRFEYLSFSPSTSFRTHIKVLIVLVVVLLCSAALQAVCVLTGLYSGLNVFAFMAAECLLLCTRTLYVIIRYGIHLHDLHLNMLWERRSIYVYYTELVCELSVLLVDFIHHCHMLIWSNIFLSMASLVICMQLRYLFHEIKRRIKRHKNYQRVVHTMNTMFAMATASDLDKNSDKCAICWDRMESARKLPCQHMFHDACLRSWLEQDISCPTCRESLVDGEQTTPTMPAEAHPGPAGDSEPETPQGNDAQTRNHFFHFDGPRYVSWFPSFSVEVTHTNILGAAGQRQLTPVQTSQFDRMAREVQSVFPNMPLGAIMGDLQHTMSVELTIENVLDGRLVAPVTNPNVQPHASTSTSDNEESLDLQAGDIGQQRATEDVTGFGVQNFLRDENLPSFETDDEYSNELETVGGRFSKNSRERECILGSRKEEMLAQARKRFLSQSKSSSRCSHLKNNFQTDHEQCMQERAEGS